MSEYRSIASITLKKGEKLVLQENSKQQQPNYYRIGNGTMNKHKIQSIDLIQEIIDSTKPAQQLIAWIKDGMQWDPYTESVTFEVKVLPETSADKQTLKRGYKELEARNLVKRTKRSHYMINPNAIIVDYNKQLAKWKSLTTE
jgi:hypothetical protein